MSKINHPSHYQGASYKTRHIIELLGVPYSNLSGECIDAIEAMGCGFHLGNAIKYLWRCGQKGDYREDLQKAVWCLKRMQTNDYDHAIEKILN